MVALGKRTTDRFLTRPSPSPATPVPATGASAPAAAPDPAPSPTEPSERENGAGCAATPLTLTMFGSAGGGGGDSAAAAAEAAGGRGIGDVEPWSALMSGTALTFLNETEQWAIRRRIDHECELFAGPPWRHLTAPASSAFKSPPICSGPMWGAYQRQHRQVVTDFHQQGVHKLSTRAVRRPAPQLKTGAATSRPGGAAALLLSMKGGKAGGGQKGGGGGLLGQLKKGSLLQAAQDAAQQRNEASGKGGGGGGGGGGSVGGGVGAGTPRHRKPPSLVTANLPAFVLERRLATLLLSEEKRAAQKEARDRSTSTPAHLKPRRIVPEPAAYREELTRQALAFSLVSPQERRRKARLVSPPRSAGGAKSGASTSPRAPPARWLDSKPSPRSKRIT